MGPSLRHGVVLPELSRLFSLLTIFPCPQQASLCPEAISSHLVLPAAAAHLSLPLGLAMASLTVLPALSSSFIQPLPTHPPTHEAHHAPSRSSSFPRLYSLHLLCTARHQGAQSSGPAKGPGYCPAPLLLSTLSQEPSLAPMQVFSVASLPSSACPLPEHPPRCTLLSSAQAIPRWPLQHCPLPPPSSSRVLGPGTRPWCSTPYSPKVHPNPRAPPSFLLTFRVHPFARCLPGRGSLAPVLTFWTTLMLPPPTQLGLICSRFTSLCLPGSPLYPPSTQ